MWLRKLFHWLSIISTIWQPVLFLSSVMDKSLQSLSFLTLLFWTCTVYSFKGHRGQHVCYFRHRITLNTLADRKCYMSKKIRKVTMTWAHLVVKSLNVLLCNSNYIYIFFFLLHILHTNIFEKARNTVLTI